MPGWDALLQRLAALPRENGTPELHETAIWLAETLRTVGVAEPALVPWTAHPYRMRAAGVVILVGALFYRLWLRRRQPARALAIAFLLPVLLVAELDHFVPLLGWTGSHSQSHVVAQIPSLAEPQQRLLFTAHFDTKTDLLDHVERAPVELLGLPAALLMVLAAGGAMRARPRGLGPGLRTAALWIAPLYGVATFAVFTGGAFVSRRSPGALDDGAACAVLVRLAERLVATPLQRTAVKIVLFSGEEIGVEGSWQYVRARFRLPPGQPTSAVNLEVIGAASTLALVRSEAFILRRYPPDLRLVATLDAVHARLRGRPLARTPRTPALSSPMECRRRHS
jgi:hypothetical protein